MTASAPSHTKGVMTELMISPEFLGPRDHVLVIDDFLAQRSLALLGVSRDGQTGFGNAVRKELAEADGVPAFVVLADKALREIAATRPRTLEQLLEVNGIGPVKADRYGSQFLAVVAQE